VEYLHVAQRRVSHSRKVGKKLEKEAKQEQKATELPNRGKLKIKVHFRHFQQCIL